MTAAQATTRQLVREAIEAAALAPSVHNTQPWAFVPGEHTLDIYADRSRQLTVLDPTGRQLHISLGCALFNARVALAAAGLGVQVERLPEAGQPDHVARLTIRAGVPPDRTLAALAAQIPRRQSNRRHFESDAVAEVVIDKLETAVAAEGARLSQVREADDRLALARLTQRADQQQTIDPAYRAEVRQWTTTDPDRLDGVRAAVVPHVDGRAHDDVPIRDFDSEGAGGLPGDTRSAATQNLFIIGTPTDGPLEWLRTGEALERAWLVITEAGLAASLFTQPIEIGAVRADLRAELRLFMQPHLVLRVGTAPPAASTQRRRLQDLVREPVES